MEIRFPRNGLHKGFGTEEQPQETSRVLMNVRPYDVIGNMARGGQRPGLKKAYTQQIGGDTLPIVALLEVSVVVVE